MVSHQTARAMANMAIFLEFSSADVLNEDAAVQMMEQLASDLQALAGNDRRALAAALQAIASSYEGQERTFIADLPDALGLG